MTLRDVATMISGVLGSVLLVGLASLLVAPAAAESPPARFKTERSYEIVLETSPSYTLAPIPLGGTK